jgi:RimJ/RimL family protein N-acetyltransferase
MMNEIPGGLILETDRVLLQPVHKDDFESFFQLAQDKEMWNYFTLNLADRSQLQKWMEMAFNDRAAGTRRPFTIIDKITQQIAGSSSLGNIAYHDKRVEIGWSWLGKTSRSSGVNRHAKYAMMRFAFEQMNFERVEFKTDVLNERARKGLKNVGGIEEGILRSHMTMWNNRRRTSIYYSVLKNEWPELKNTIFSDIKHYEFH